MYLLKFNDPQNKHSSKTSYPSVLFSTISVLPPELSPEIMLGKKTPLVNPGSAPEQYSSLPE